MQQKSRIQIESLLKQGFSKINIAYASFYYY